MVIAQFSTVQGNDIRPRRTCKRADGRKLQATRNLLCAGIVALLSLLASCERQPYGFFDDSVSGERQHIVMDGRGGYKVYSYRRDSPLTPQNRTTSETGTYEDTGREEITLTTSDGRIYKIRVWKREDKDAQYRVLGQ